MSVTDLSKRELEVLEAMASGMSNLAISQRLFLSEHTIEKHAQNLYAKLDLHPTSNRVNRRVVAVLKYLETGR